MSDCTTPLIGFPEHITMEKLEYYCFILFHLLTEIIWSNLVDAKYSKAGGNCRAEGNNWEIDRNQAEK